MAREALRQFGVATPDEVVGAAGAMWANLTEEWLTHRVRSGDGTKSRWAVSPVWRDIQHATLRGDSIGLARTYRAQRLGYLDGITPQTVGYLARVAAYTNAAGLREVLPELVNLVHRYEERTGVTFTERVTDKRREKHLL